MKPFKGNSLVLEKCDKLELMLVDIYWWIDSRNRNYLDNIMDRYVPERIQEVQDFWFPLNSDLPSQIFYSYEELMLYLERTNDEYSIYLKNTDKTSIIKSLMLFYTTENACVLGVSIDVNSVESGVVKTFFCEVKNELGVEYGFITVEEYPPNNKIEFLNYCSTRISFDC